MALQSGMVHLSHFRMLIQEINHLQGILHMTFHTQTQGLYTLQQDEGIERRDGSTRITQDDGTDSGDVGCCAYSIGKNDAMIAWVGLSQCGEHLGIRLPIELASVHDDTT